MYDLFKFPLFQRSRTAVLVIILTQPATSIRIFFLPQLRKQKQNCDGVLRSMRNWKAKENTCSNIDDSAEQLRDRTFSPGFRGTLQDRSTGRRDRQRLTRNLMVLDDDIRRAAKQNWRPRRDALLYGAEPAASATTSFHSWSGFERFFSRVRFPPAGT